MNEDPTVKTMIAAAVRLERHKIITKLEQLYIASMSAGEKLTMQRIIDCIRERSPDSQVI